MISKSLVNQTRHRFARPHTILLLLVLVSTILWVFFPQDELLQDLNQNHQPSMVTVNYLENLLLLYPEYTKLRLSLVKQLVNLHQYNQAKYYLSYLNTKSLETSQADSTRWLQYQIQEGLIETSKVSLKQQLARKKQQLTKLMTGLQTTQLSLNALSDLALDAAAINETQLAKVFYLRLLNSNLPARARTYERGARAALSMQDYQNSSRLFFKAQQYSHTLTQQRGMFMAGIRSLQAGNFVKQAIDVAELHLGDLQADRATLIFLTKVALAADKPHIAQDYIKAAIKLPKDLSRD